MVKNNEKTCSYKINNCTAISLFLFFLLSSNAKTNINRFSEDLNVIYKIQHSEFVLVQGLVTDENGTAMEGVIVLLRERAKKVKTDSSGHYAISAPINEHLEFSYLGFKIKTIRVSKKNSNVKLKKI